MKVTGKPVPTSVGFFFIGFAAVAAVVILPGAKSAQSPFLFVCIFGGLFVGVPAALGIGVILENRRKRTPR
jgi:predicted membrane-bound mannosyltransferase